MFIDKLHHVIDVDALHTVADIKIKAEESSSAHGCEKLETSMSSSSNGTLNLAFCSDKPKFLTGNSDEKLAKTVASKNKTPLKPRDVCIRPVMRGSQVVCISFTGGFNVLYNILDLVQNANRAACISVLYPKTLFDYCEKLKAENQATLPNLVSAFKNKYTVDELTSDLYKLLLPPNNNGSVMNMIFMKSNEEYKTITNVIYENINCFTDEHYVHRVITEPVLHIPGHMHEFSLILFSYIIEKAPQVKRNNNSSSSSTAVSRLHYTF